MKILVICHYFAPEPGAPQARLLERGGGGGEGGAGVEVLTGFPNHPSGVLAPGDRGRWYRRDHLDGLVVHRCRQFVTPNRGILRKTLAHLSFMATGALFGLFRVRRPDVVVVSSPTFFSVYTAWLLSRLWRVPFVFEVRDLWPAIFTELGVLRHEGAIRLLERMELWLYGRAARVVTVTEGFAENIVGRGIPAEKVATITNGVDTDRFRPRTDRARLRAGLGLADGFTVLYIGAHGISHALGRILDVAQAMRDESDVRFLFVGDGAEKAGLIREARARGLANVEFRPPVPKERVPEYYAAADVCLVPLRDVPLFSTFIPSKLFEILGAGRPIVASVAGESAAILERSGGALVVPPEDVDGIARSIRSLRDDAALRDDLGRRGREFVVARYSRRRLARRYLRILLEIAPGRGGRR